MTFENIEIAHLQHALRGMRNAMNGWDKSDTTVKPYEAGAETNPVILVGPSDDALAHRLIRAGQPHRKFLRQIHGIVDITAPAYFWAELDTYKIGTVRNSSSFMHTGIKRPFSIDDFEVEPEVREVLSPYIPADRDYSLTYQGDLEAFKYYTASDGRRYKVFRCGKVVRCAFVRTRKMSDGRTIEDPMPEKELKPAQANTGYYHLSIAGKMIYLHRLIASVWCDRHDGCDVVDHIDGNKGNNSAENLEWVTRSENDSRKIKSGLAPFWGSIRHRYLQYKANNLPERIRLDIVAAYEENTAITFKDISDRFGVCETRVADIIRGTDVVDRKRNMVFNNAMYWERTIDTLNQLRQSYIDTGDDMYFVELRKLLPMGYLYRSTWSFSYENLLEIWRWRHTHRLPIWHQFCEEFIEKLPYAEFVTKYPYED